MCNHAEAQLSFIDQLVSVKKQCSVLGCVKTPRGQASLCECHRWRLRRTGTTDEPKRFKTAKTKPLKEMTKEEYKQYSRDGVKRSRIKHRLKRNAEGKIWREKNKERYAAMKKAWAKANPDKVRAQRKRTAMRHKVSQRAYLLKWQRANKDKTKLYRASHYQKKVAVDPEYYLLQSANRRALVRASGGKLSRGIVQKLLTAQKGYCPRCLAELSETGHHLDHVMPLSKGGLHEDSNMMLLCPTCNLSKAAKIIKVC